MLHAAALSGVGRGRHHAQLRARSACGAFVEIFPTVDNDQYLNVGIRESRQRTQAFVRCLHATLMDDDDADLRTDAQCDVSGPGVDHHVLDTYTYMEPNASAGNRAFRVRPPVTLLT